MRQRDPFCTTPTQQFARAVLATVCGLCVLGLAVSMRAVWTAPALRHRAYGFVLLVFVFAVVLLVVDPAHRVGWHSRARLNSARGGIPRPNA
ncbi:hypothetical protein [Conexibacter sp. CPCC 206217]|uniref:hypothetical protein n=1 Tax=Conexibacter sp. CPCC 206217 TaxID=3064574 RepID=UPI00271B4023|nr:hypothetical protein [Conexibacter sp. CPCC 206217]MDO8210110.1 hypothetical protein [Conexibacter sp. CPCC 206217]